MDFAKKLFDYENTGRKEGRKKEADKNGCPKSNERYTKCGGFDKLNHRNANLLDSPTPICACSDAS